MPVAGLPATKLDAPLAIVLLARDGDQVARAMAALLPVLDSGVPVLAGGSAAGRVALDALDIDREIFWLDCDGPAAWNVAADIAPAADLLLIDEATEVGPASVTGLTAVADAEPDAATVSALTNSGEFLSAPNRNLPWPLLPVSETPASAARKVADGALRIHPRTPAALPHFALVRRSALQLIGGFDEALRAREALADFCIRATESGLQHVVADEVFVAHRGADAQTQAGGWEGEAADRHPDLAAAIYEAGTDRHSALARSLGAASVSLEPLRVTIDARCLGPGMTGTVVHTVELIGALSVREDVRVRALLPEQPGVEALQALRGMAAVRLFTEPAAGEVIARDHVVHRPWQIESVADMVDLDRFGERTVITNQDLIGYRNPAGFASPAQWREYRAHTRDSLGLAAMVLFFSGVARDDALAEDLVSPARARVVPIGALPAHLRFAGEPRRPPAIFGSRPFLLVVGNRFRHKNIRFALRLLAALREEHGWDGDLVIAGAEVLHGTGSGDDAAWLVRNPGHAPHVQQIGAVSEAEKAWLMAECAALVYPSTYEGFGLVPFEAAAAGRPALVAHTSAMRETIPRELAMLVPWDASLSARRSIALLRDEAEAKRLVAGIRAAGAKLTWERTGKELSAAYREAVQLPAPISAKVAVDLANREQADSRPSIAHRLASRARRTLSH